MACYTIRYRPRWKATKVSTIHHRTKNYVLWLVSRWCMIHGGGGKDHVCVSFTVDEIYWHGGRFETLGARFLLSVKCDIVLYNYRLVNCNQFEQASSIYRKPGKTLRALILWNSFLWKSFICMKVRIYKIFFLTIVQNVDNSACWWKYNGCFYLRLDITVQVL